MDRAKRRSIGMALGSKYRAKQDCIGIARVCASLQRMSSACNKPIWPARAPMRRLSRARFRQMDAMSMDLHRKFRIIRDQQDQIAFMGHARKHSGQLRAMRLLPRPQNHHVALGQCAGRSDGIGQAFVIRQQDKCRQPASCVEPRGLSC